MHTTFFINLKQKFKEDTLNKQENLMNSNKQSCSTIINTSSSEDPVPCLYLELMPCQKHLQKIQDHLSHSHYMMIHYRYIKTRCLPALLLGVDFNSALLKGNVT